MTDELMYPSSAIEDICKREREKVLDKVITILNEEIGLENLPVITRRLQELRQKAGE
jgi:hypothetical protein